MLGVLETMGQLKPAASKLRRGQYAFNRGWHSTHSKAPVISPHTFTSPPNPALFNTIIP